MPLLMAHGLDVVQTNSPLAFDPAAIGRRRSRSRAADVEGTHGELSARFADGLRRNDAHRLADVDAMSTTQVAAIALSANAVTGFAGNGRTHHDLIDTHFLQQLDQLLVDQYAGFEQ